MGDLDDAATAEEPLANGDEQGVVEFFLTDHRDALPLPAEHRQIFQVRGARVGRVPLGSLNEFADSLVTVAYDVDKSVLEPARSR